MATGVTRRRAGLSAMAAAATLEGCEGRPAADPQPSSRTIPKGFVWGAATSAFQIEGSLDADGRKPSIWDGFQHLHGRIADGSDASVACDSYRRWSDDVDLLAGAAMNAYRFSIAWTRVVPDGAGPPNAAGLDYYSRLVDGLLTKGVAPYATLFHWDLPQALQDKGGWARRDTAQRFAEYADVVGRRLGDRIKHVITLNEAAVHTIVGHVLGEHAPGLKDAALLGPVTHHQNLAQGLAIQALRSARSDLSIGATLALQPCRGEGAPLAFWNRPAADGLSSIFNHAYLDPLMKGSYPSAMDAPLKGVLRDGDLKTTRQPIDFLGVNYYAPTYVKLDLGSPSHIAPGVPPKGTERDAFDRQVDPSGLSEVLAWLRTDYGNPHVLITENGCSDAFTSGPAKIDDAFRIAYLRRHLAAVLEANERGSRVGGYFVWSLVDNWEWERGFTSKFGVVAQASPGGARTPKASHAWLRSVIRSGVLPV